MHKSDRLCCVSVFFWWFVLEYVWISMRVELCVWRLCSAYCCCVSNTGVGMWCRPDQQSSIYNRVRGGVCVPLPTVPIHRQKLSLVLVSVRLLDPAQLNIYRWYCRNAGGGISAYSFHSYLCFKDQDYVGNTVHQKIKYACVLYALVKSKELFMYWFVGFNGFTLWPDLNLICVCRGRWTGVPPSK